MAILRPKFTYCGHRKPVVGFVWTAPVAPHSTALYAGTSDGPHLFPSYQLFARLVERQQGRTVSAHGLKDFGMLMVCSQRLWQRVQEKGGASQVASAAYGGCSSECAARVPGSTHRWLQDPKTDLVDARRRRHSGAERMANFLQFPSCSPCRSSDNAIISVNS